MATRDELTALLAKVGAKRDRAAFDALYAATAPQLFGVLLRILRRREAAEDVLQDTFLKIWDRAADYKPDLAAPLTWMATIARNRALDVARKKVPRSLEEVDAFDQVPTTDPDALAQVETRDDLRRLRACLDRIEAERRDMVVLAYRDGLTREELAKRYKTPVNTIKTWLHRSLKQLKDCLGP